MFNANEFIEKSMKEIQAKVGDKRVLSAASGGVDSTVVSILLQKAIGKQLTCIFVDTGLMRKNEGAEVKAIFDAFGVHLIYVEAEDRFLSKLSGVVDPEEKRKIIGEEFIRVFEEEAKKIGTVDFLAQGTIYPDIVESGTEGHAVVKSHHNVGGLPDVVDFEDLIEPVRDLYKPEVREVGRALGIPDKMVDRQPFPGPGLAVRCIGECTKNKLDTLRHADAIFREEIANAGLDKQIWQYFAIITDLQSVGVKDNARTYCHTIALRAVHTQDAMTAEWAKIPYEVLQQTSKRICTEVTGVNRVVYDITSKPPATIEWE